MTDVEMVKVVMKWPDFSKQPINTFKLPSWYLSFRGDIAEERDLSPDYFVDYDVDINSDDLFFKHLYRFQSKSNPFLNLTLGILSWDFQQLRGGFLGGSRVTISVARVQNIPNVVDVRQEIELERAVQFLFDKEDKGKNLGPDFCWIQAGANVFLRENCSLQGSYPAFAFFMPIDHRHVLIIDCSCSGFLPMGEVLPPPLLEGVMDGIKDFLSYIQLEKSDD